MNHCILLVEVVQAPQVRYTSDQVPVAEMIVQFNTPRENDPPATLKLVAWNRVATEVEQQGYRIGDRLLVEGRISMVTIDRQEGFREKRAELRAQRIQSLAALSAGMSAGMSAGAPAYVPPLAAAPAPQAPIPQPNYAPPIPQPNYAPPSNVAQFPTPITQAAPVNPPINPPINPPSVPGAPPAAPQTFPQAAPPASPPDFDDDDIPF
jgi:single-stranded DNA-binding protein